MRRIKKWVQNMGKDTFSLRRGLLWVSLSSTLPLLCFLGALLAYLTDLQYDATRQQLLSSGQSVGLVMERYFQQANVALSLVNNSDALRMGDIAQFRVATWPQLIRAIDDTTICVFDSNGNLIVSSSPDVSQANAKEYLPLLSKLKDSESGKLSGLLQTETARFVGVSSAIRLEDGNDPAYYLLLKTDAKRISEMLRQVKLPANWIAALLDSSGNIIARTKDLDNAFGRKSPEEFLRGVTGHESGLLRTPSYDGTEDYLVGFSKVPGASWHALVAVEYQAHWLPVARVFAGTLAGGLVLTAFGIFASMLLSRRMTGPIHELRRAARALGRGEPLGMVEQALRLQETRGIAEGLQASAVQLERTNVDREKALTQLKASAETLERRVAERTEELEKARFVAEDASQAKSDFLARMSHEIRTPLTGALGHTDLMLEEDLPPELAERVQLLRRSLTALHHMLSNMLDFARMRAEKLDLESMPFSPSATVRDAIALIEPSATKKGLVTARDTRALPTRVVGDAYRLRQVLANLLKNALTHTESGSISINTWVSEGGSIMGFDVQDTGVGISEDGQERLFDAFYVGTSVARDQGGVGLGLPICHGLVKAMGGELTVSSVVGKGTTFTFFVRVTPLGAVDSIENPKQSTPTFAGRILLAEDNPTTRELVVSMLRRTGHLIDAVADGKQAVEALEQNHYDVILMDMQMPVLNGRDAARRIRALGDEKAQSFIIALSADGEPVRRGAGGATFNAYEPKPIEWDSLERKIQRGIALQMEREGLTVPAVGSATAGLQDALRDAPVLDENTLKLLMSRLGPEQLAKLVSNVPTNLTGQLNQASQAFENEDVAGTQAAAHGLLSTARAFGMAQFSLVAQAVQREPSPQLLTQLQELLPRSLEALHAWTARSLSTPGASEFRLTSVR